MFGYEINFSYTIIIEFFNKLLLMEDNDLILSMLRRWKFLLDGIKILRLIGYKYILEYFWQLEAVPLLNEVFRKIYMQICLCS